MHSGLYPPSPGKRVAKSRQRSLVQRTRCSLRSVHPVTRAPWPQNPAPVAYLQSQRPVLHGPGAHSRHCFALATFGSYAANFHPHIHALATQGAFRSTGEFVEVGTINTDVLEQLFRRLVLTRLHRAERLSAEFRDTLLAWTHSGFSVHAGPRLYPWEAGHLARLGRYIARVPMPQKEVRLTEAGKVRILTPPDPRTGGTELELDSLDWIPQVVEQIPAPRQHLTRYYGAYANRRRRKLHAAWSAAAEGERGATEARPAPQHAHPQEQPRAAALSPAPSVQAEQLFQTPPEDPPPRPACRSSWARLLRKIFEVDPLLCPQCQTEMKVVSVITDPAVIDAILSHIRQKGGRDPFEGRRPPATGSHAAGMAGLAV